MSRDPQTAPDEQVLRVALAIQRTMFAPHELPLSEGMHAQYMNTARAAIAAMEESHTNEALLKLRKEISKLRLHRCNGTKFLWDKDVLAEIDVAIEEQNAKA